MPFSVDSSDDPPIAIVQCVFSVFALMLVWEVDFFKVVFDASKLLFTT